MPYLNLDLDYFAHPKIVRLAGKLGAEHIAIPLKLWCYVGKYHCVDGMLKAYSKQEVEQALGWTGESGKLVDTLVEIRLLDIVGKEYKVHDWKEHAGHLSAFKKRAKTAAKKRWTRYATSNAKDKTTTAPTLPPIPTKPIKRESRAERLATLEGFVVSEESRAWARKEFGVEIPEDVVVEFKDHWRGQKNLRSDWDATFRNRIRQLVGWKILAPGKVGAPAALPQALKTTPRSDVKGEPCPPELREKLKFISGVGA